MKKKGGDERTQPPTSNKGVDKFINKTDDEYPDEPTSNVGCSSESPIPARRLRIWENGDSIKREGEFLNEYITRRKTYWKMMNTALKSKKDCKGM
jgi:hypothetical protein